MIPPEIRAAEIKEKMRIQEPGMDEITVATVGWHGDTVLITDDAGGEHTFDRDTVVELLEPIKLVCPVCGSGDELVSWEMEPTGYFGTRFFQNPDDPDDPEINYDSADTKSGEGGSGFVDDLQCNNHNYTVLELNLSDLVPEGTPPNPEWKWPADRRARLSAESGIDQIAAMLNDRGVDFNLIVAVVRATGRNMTETNGGPTHG